MSEGPIKFICDEQLGKLSRWLRVIGQDALYEREIEDDVLLARARGEGRVALTRDRGLAEVAPPGVRVVCLESNYPAHQLREVVELFSGRIEIAVFSRCVSCNGEVREASRSEVAGLVPPFVFETRDRFTRCLACGKIYWKATHRDRVEIQLRDVLGAHYRGEAE